MDPRERWQALQTQLARAQEYLRTGDRAGALEAIDAALAIDPNFLAAHALRDRAIAAVGLVASPAAKAATPEPVQVRPLVSAEGYAQFEQRARRRRVDRRLDAARLALVEGRRHDAASAIDEIRELDPKLPELPELLTAFAGMPVPTEASSRAGRWLAAAAVFGTIVLGATWLQESGALGSRSIIAVAPLIAPPQPLTVTVSAAEAADLPLDITAGTSADIPVSAVDRLPPARPVTNIGSVATMPAAAPLNNPLVSPAVSSLPPPAAVAPPPVATFVSGPIASPTPPPPSIPPPPAVAPAPAVTPAAAVIVPIDDESLVQQTLQRYRSAYEGLDAHSARAVWPAVNEAALARAFDGLASQSLTFDACDVSLKGEAAAATCRGTTRYVTKVGSREPRTEPRTWNFTLHKRGSGWAIESARTNR